MAEQRHMSIGEVLAFLQEEFPDVTISKIRFLESQGLVEPERTPSGYRKFYDGDIRRLRWILQQQRDHFLPLKVIKTRLEGGFDPTEEDLDAEREAQGEAQGEAAARVAALQEAPTPSRSSNVSSLMSQSNRRASAARGETALDRPSAMSREELLEATGLSSEILDELEHYGLVEGGAVGATSFYDRDALEVGRLASRFLQHGVEVRHLRMYKVAGDREASLFEQLILPILKQRNPVARKQAIETLDELVALGEGLRAAAVRQALRSHYGR